MRDETSSPYFCSGGMGRDGRAGRESLLFLGCSGVHCGFLCGLRFTLGMSVWFYYVVYTKKIPSREDAMIDESFHRAAQDGTVGYRTVEENRSQSIYIKRIWKTYLSISIWYSTPGRLHVYFRALADHLQMTVGQSVATLRDTTQRLEIYFQQLRVQRHRRWHDLLREDACGE